MNGEMCLTEADWTWTDSAAHVAVRCCNDWMPGTKGNWTRKTGSLQGIDESSSSSSFF